jgi:mercuric ion transport protein
MKDRVFIGASILAAVAASLCCILPIVFAIGGVSILGASAAFAAWRPYLLGLTFALLGVGFYLAYRKPRKTCCEADAACARSGFSRLGRAGLWIAVFVVVAFAAFPYYSGGVAKLLLAGDEGKTVQASTSESRLEHITLAIQGMDCPACATAIQRKLEMVSGVDKATVSYQRGRAEVDYDPRSTSPARLQQAVQEAGYPARPM